jgi:hypothetical protein
MIVVLVKRCHLVTRAAQSKEGPTVQYHNTYLRHSDPRYHDWCVCDMMDDRRQ